MVVRRSTEQSNAWLKPVEDDEDEGFLTVAEDAEAKGILDDGNRSTLNLTTTELPVYMNIHR
jgi:hypothetical protein